jgi:type II secretory pathway component PulF
MSTSMDALAVRMGDLVAAEAPLPEGLRAAAAEAADPRIRAGLAGLADDIEAGSTIDAALEAQAARVPPHQAALIRAGLRSGRLPEALQHLTGDARLGRQVYHRLALRLLYPALFGVLTLALLALFSGLNAVSTFPSIFADFGLDLPPVTVQVFRVLRAFHGHGGGIIVGPLAALGLTLVAARFLLTPDEVQQLRAGLPLLGPLERDVSLAGFCRLLGWLHEARVPQAEALRLAADATLPTAMRGAADRAARELTAGRPLAEALRAAPPFPPEVAPYLGWATSLPEPAPALALAADVFEARAQARGAFLARLLTLLAVTVILALAAVVVISVLLPMIRLITSLSG